MKVDNETRQKILSAGNVKLLSTKYRVRWGGINLLHSLLYMAEEALKNEEIRFFHWISGQDFPVKEQSYFENTLDCNNDYLEYFEIPADCWENGGWSRWEQYHLYDIFDAKKHLRLIRLISLIQKNLFIKRKFSGNIPKLYGGSTWWSLTRDTLKYVVDYTKNNQSLIKRLKHTFAPDELYFLTVIMNSDFAKDIINDNLRYINWNKSNMHGNPPFLDVTDFSPIKSSNKLFARKFHDKKSSELKSMLINAQN